MLLTFDPKGRDVYRSENDGKDWTNIDDVKGKAVEFVQHPFDKDRAVIFSDGKDHWATKDKGKTWKKFTVDLPVSIRQMPLAFSAANPDHVLYAGQQCDPDDIWGYNCPDKVGYLRLGVRGIRVADLVLCRPSTRRIGSVPCGP